MTIINFDQGYQVPDVYIQQILTQTAAVSAIDTPVVALVGPTRGYLTNTDSVALSATVPVTLSELGINTASVSIVSAQGVSYSSGNYTVVSTAGTTANANTVTIVLSGGSSITPGSVVYVTYQYTNVNYALPVLYTAYQDILNAFGQPMDINNNIISPISLAAQFVFANGGSQIVIAPTGDISTATRAGLSAAYLKLSNQNDISIVVPLPVGMTGTSGAPGDVINVGSDLSQYCDSLATNTILRTGFVGYETTSTVSPTTISASISDARIMNFYPNSLGYFNGLSNQTATIGGYYLAAACAGYLVSQAIQTPLTKKVISGFNGIPSSTLATMTPSYKNNLSSQGVAVLEPNSNKALWIRHGVTTLGTSIITQEISLVRAADTMIQVIHDTLENSGLIGSPSTSNSPSQVQGLVMAVLEQLVADGIIIAYSGLSATLQSTTPTVIAVTYAYSPSYPLNYITVAFTVDTSSGALAAVTS